MALYRRNDGSHFTGIMALSHKNIHLAFTHEEYRKLANNIYACDASEDTLAIFSDGEGKGTEVVIKIPLVQELPDEEGTEEDV